MPLNRLRERINLVLYDHKEPLFKVLGVLHLVVALSAIGLLVYYYGYPQTEDSKGLIIEIIQYTFIFYIFRFFIKFFYDFHPLTYLKNNWFEGIVMLLLIAEGIAYNFFGILLVETAFRKLGVRHIGDFYTIIVQFFFLIIILNQISKKRNFNPWFKLHPALLFMLSIFTLITIGTFLLLLPEMSHNGLAFEDALFMSTSSVSVTGLATIDIAETLTFKGQIIIMGLIQLGGLNTIAFGALLILMAKFGVGIKHHEVIEDFVNKNSILKTNSMLGKIILWTLSIEIVGIVLIYFSLGDQGYFADNTERVYQSVFHGISGFNNAGLSVMPGGTGGPLTVNNYPFQIIILVLFFLGGLGMVYLFDLFGIRQLRERMKHPWKTIDFGTKISLYTTLILLFIGAVVFMIFEWNNTMGGKNIFEKTIISLFQSMTTRNAGFNMVDTGALSVPVIIIFLFLMFVGASSGSSGGGIRTSTFAIMYASVISTIRGKKHTELFKRTINNDLVMKAYSIFLFFVAANVIGPFLLAITEENLLSEGYTFMDLVFEHVSAFSTVGLSTGITPDLSAGGKTICIISMFIGRVGTLTLAYLLGKKVISNKYKYPEGTTMIG